MAELVANMVVGPLLSVLKEKASSYLLDQYKVMEGMEEQHRILTHKLPAILDIITDAEEAASQRPGPKAWLLAVKKVAYDANEIFDEFKYEALRRQAKENGHYYDLGFGVVKLFPSHNRLAFRGKMGKKLRRVVQDIGDLVADMNAFGFNHQQQAPASEQWRQKDHVIFDPKKIISRSRHQDTRNIVGKLLGHASNENLMVIPIVGVGGLGKTTLAQLIYNEPEIQKHFQLRRWVSVSDSFDVDSLANSIAETHPERSKDEEASKKSPLDSLQDALSGHRYLLVLDDVWNRDPSKWEILKARLTDGAKGSVVLTTTRDERVAKIMGTVKSYNLAALEDSFIKEIIETRAFSLQKEEERPAVLLNMVGEIVKRCQGSPLAATALGSVLQTKSSEEEWTAVSNSSSICTKESGILPILKLSYNDLPSQMKQCFSFCAVFPKGYEIDVDKLIQLWVAHGFIQEQKEVRPETIGKRIFSELAERSFFVDVKHGKVTIHHYSKHTCKIHDLMHDVALSTMEEECALAPKESSQIEWLSDTTRHLILSCEEPETILNGSLAKRSPPIQTLMCDCFMKDSLQHLSKYSSLKALQLHTFSRSFPLKSKHLHHLRYLDLSKSHIEALPEDISILYNLQTLNVSGCSKLRRLPTQMKYMIALRHLYTHDCPNMKSMPADLRKLISLQTITCFVAGPVGSECSDVGELQQLNLGGQLELHQLENVTEKDAKAANLQVKKEIRDLKLKWTVGCRDDARVLEGLKPHDGLKVVRIGSYGGTTFPTWMAMLRNMVEIHLSNCTELQWLFGFDAPFTFPNLKEFTLQGLKSLERWWETSNEEQGKEIIFPQLEKLSIVGCAKLTTLPEATLLGESYGTMARSTFPSLKVLNLYALDSFRGWEATKGTQRGHIVFPKLEVLTIEYCPVMTLSEVPFGGDYSMAVVVSQGEEIMFPRLEKLHVVGCAKMRALPGQQKVCPKLSDLFIEGSEEELLLWVARNMTTLTKVILQKPRVVTATNSADAEHSLAGPVDVMEKWNHNDFPLADMKLVGFKSGVTELCTCFVQLHHLDIVDCAALVHWPEKEFQSLVYLRKLRIGSCKQLVGYTEAPVAEPATTSESSIQLLPSLEYLLIYDCETLVEVFKLPASLRRMKIYGCAKLRSIFSGRLQQEQSSSSNLRGPSPVHSDASSVIARAEQFLFPCLEYIHIERCDSLTGVLVLPPSLKELIVYDCGELRSVESQSGEMPSLETLSIIQCKTMSSLPDEPQAYPSLKELKIVDCPGIKKLPTCLQQRLSSLEQKEVDARYEELRPSLLKPKTWKFAICRE